MKIVSKAFVEGFYYKPRVDLELLEKYHEGIIALSACLAGEVARYLARGMYEDAKIAHYVIRIFSEKEISFWSFRIMGSGAADRKPAASPYAQRDGDRSGCHQ
jgi:DNA polymerase III alpha subunit